MMSVGTLPSGVSARYSGERMSSFLNDIGLPSKATPISCSAMCTAIELEPGAKYKVSMLQYLGCEGALPLPPISGLPEMSIIIVEVGYVRLRTREGGVRVYGLSLGCNPSPGLLGAIRPLPTG